MYIVIVNPTAGNGKAKKIFDHIRHSTYLKNDTIFYTTQYSGHVAKIVEEIEQYKKDGLQIDLLFIIGGDGTINEVINALPHYDIPITYIPGGTGNDFARGINCDKHPDKIIEQAIKNRREITYWLGHYETSESDKKKFVNCLGFGFDAVVAKSASTLSIRNVLSILHLDSLIYLFALLRELITYNPLQITVCIDGEKRQFSNVLFLTVSNQPYMGGGMKINPDAQNNKDIFSVIVVDSIPKWKVFLLFGTVFFGKHVLFKEVHTFQASEITISSKSKLPCQVDGEYTELHVTTVKKFGSPLKIKGTNLK